MKYWLIAGSVVVLFAACRQTTSPSVPKAAIERGADTKIQDAGTADADADAGK
jgi:hypothetical protein